MAAPALAVVGTAPVIPNAFDHGEYRTPDGETLGTFRASTPARRDRTDGHVVTTTTILDADGRPVLTLLRRPYLPWMITPMGTRCRAQHELVGDDGALLAIARARARSIWSRLRIGIQTVTVGDGVLIERRARGERRFEVHTDAGVELATITARSELNVMTEIWVDHATTDAAWRTTIVALATCLPAFGVGGPSWMGADPVPGA
ncbi:MAG: hypothetical protein ABW033_07735 [Acidimicrobiia bacterium]